MKKTNLSFCLFVAVFTFLGTFKNTALAGVNITAPCRGTTQTEMRFEVWRSCVDYFRGKYDNFDYTVIGRGDSTTFEASRGVLNNLKSRMQGRVDNLYKIGPTRCDVTGSQFTGRMAEEEKNNKGKDCGEPLGVEIPDPGSIVLNLMGNAGSLEESYIFGMHPQIASCEYDKRISKITTEYNTPPSIEISGSCSAPAVDYERYRKMAEAVFVSRNEALKSCASRENTQVDAQGTQSNFGNNSVACLKLQAARQVLEAMFASLIHCDAMEQAQRKYVAIAGSVAFQNELIKDNADQVQNLYCEGPCSEPARNFDPLEDSIDDVLNETEACSNACYRQHGPANMIEFIKRQTKKACGASMSWTTALTALSLLFRPRRGEKRTRRFSPAQILMTLLIGIALGLGGCSKKGGGDKKVKDDKKTEPPGSTAPESADISGEIASLQAKLDELKTNFDELEDLYRDGSGGTNMSPTPSVTVTVTPTATASPTITVTTNPTTTSLQGEPNPTTTGGTSNNPGGVASTGTNVNADAVNTGLSGANFGANSGIATSALGNLPGLNGLNTGSGSGGGSASAASKGKGGSGGYSGSANGTDPAANALTEVAPGGAARIAGAIEGVGGGAGGGGGMYGSGGGGSGANGEPVTGAGGSAEGLAFKQNPEGADRAIASGDAYSETYFTLIGQNESIFDAVHRQYLETEMVWAKQDAGISK